MNRAKVSVIVPVYNTEDYLQQCIESIQNQTLAEIEIVIVDDGSKDSSPAIIDRLITTDKRIVTVRQPNSGLAAARNHGIDIASGDFVTFVDSDDYIHEETLDRCHSLALADESDIVIYSFQQISTSGRRVKTPPVNSYDSTDEYFRHVLSSKDSSMVCNKLFRRELFVDSNIRFPVGLYHEDVPTTFKLFHIAKSISVVEKPMYFWVRREDSISKTISEKHALDLIAGFYLTRNYLARHDILETYWPYFARRVIHFSMGIISRTENHQGVSEAAEWAELVHRWMKSLGVTSQASLEAINEYDPGVYSDYMKRFKHVPSTDSPGTAQPEVVELERQVRAALQELAQIKESRGFRKYQQLSTVFERIFPPGSMRRKLIKKFGTTPPKTEQYKSNKI